MNGERGDAFAGGTDELPCFAAVFASEEAARLASGEEDFGMRGVEADHRAAQGRRAFAVEVVGETERLSRLPAVAPASRTPVLRHHFIRIPRPRRFILHAQQRAIMRPVQFVTQRATDLERTAFGILDALRPKS